MSARDLLPDILTLARLPLAAAFVLEVDRPIVALALVLTAAISDVADGWCARALGRATPAGALLDVAADKVFALTVALTLVAHGKLTLGAAMLLGAREVAELPLLAVVVIRGAVVHATSSVAGKLTTALQFATFVTLLVGGRAWEPLLAAVAASGIAAATGYWAGELRADRP